MKLNRLLVFDGALELNKTAIESTKNEFPRGKFRLLGAAVWYTAHVSSAL